MSAAAQVLITLAGWSGAICSVVAYGLVTMKRITPDSAAFQLLNLLGAGLLSVSSTVHGAWPSAVVNVIWVGIGVLALRTIWRRRKTSKVAAPKTFIEETDLAGATQDLLAARAAEEFLAAGHHIEACDDSAGRISVRRVPVTV